MRCGAVSVGEQTQNNVLFYHIKGNFDWSPQRDSSAGISSISHLKGYVEKSPK